MITENTHKEGRVAKVIENQTAKLPSDLFLWAGLGSLTAAFTLAAMGKKHAGLLVGQLAAPFLIFGLYDKLVKLEGHDKADKNETTSDDSLQW